MAYTGQNLFSLLDEEGGSGPSKGAKKGSSAAPKVKAPLSGFPGEQPAGAKNHSARVPDRQKNTHATEGGARGGFRGNRGGRGGRGGASDGVHRQFDRRGAPTKHAPNHAHRDGAALGPEGGVDAPVHQGESAADVTEVAAVEDVPDMVIEAVDPEDDGKVTYEQYIANKRTVDDDANRNIREIGPVDESLFQKAKPLKREDDDEESKEDEDASERRAKKEKKKQVISLDEFRGGREADKDIRRAAPFESRGGRGGPRGGAARGGRGGRGGFTPREGGAAPAGDAPRGGRGGRGGNARGGAAPRGGRGGPSVAINDKNAFPALQ